MKKFELSAYGVEEMNQKENCVTSGGWIPLAISLMGVLVYVYNEGDSFIDGFEEGWNNTRN